MMNQTRLFQAMVFWCAALLFSGPAYSVQNVSPAKQAVEWLAPVEIASGNGQKGPWQQNESRFDYVDDPAITLSEDGEVLCVWVDQQKKDVFLQRIDRYGGMKLFPPVNVSVTPKTFSWLPKVAIESKNREKVFVLWQEIIFSGASHGGEIFFSRSEDGGKSFLSPVNISRSLGGDGKGRINREVWHNGSFDLAIGPQGRLHVAWTEYDGALWLASSMDGGISFSKPRRIAGSDTHPARGPSIAVDDKGIVHLAWTTGENDAADILVAKSVDDGKSFTEPMAIEPNTSYSDAPKLAIDSKGIIHLAYAESDGGPFGSYHVRYTRSTNDAAGFEKSKKLSGQPPDSSTGAAFPYIAIDGNDNVILAWERFAGPKEQPKGLAITISQDAGDTFSAPSIIPASIPIMGANGSHQGLLMEKLAVNREGLIAIANSSLAPGKSSRVWLMRGRLAN